ncbi:hypothetical protein INT45_007796 [Circinella minor]|uniref:Uncharacterized protein n=1 Tax=Circinella minor TaxID=1195481 RepID=A0A8H7V121_9FUNG|nr:hypothetical protein INT45_007796 [Circinella minor]
MIPTIPTFFLIVIFVFSICDTQQIRQQHPVGQEVCKKAVLRNGTLDTSCPWFLGWLLVGRCWRGWSCCVGGQFSDIFFWFSVALVGLVWSRLFCSVVSLRFVRRFGYLGLCL